MPAGDARGEETNHRMTDQERDPEAATGPETATDETEPANDESGTDTAEAAEAEATEAEDGDQDEDAGDAFAEPEAAAPAAPSRRKRRNRDAAKALAAAPSVAEEAVHITDRASALFVIGVTLVFVVILLNGMLLGHRGFITEALATPKPTPVVTPSPAVTAGAVW